MNERRAADKKRAGESDSAKLLERHLGLRLLCIAWCRASLKSTGAPNKIDARRAITTERDASRSLETTGTVMFFADLNGRSSASEQAFIAAAQSRDFAGSNMERRDDCN